MSSGIILGLIIGVPIGLMLDNIAGGIAIDIAMAGTRLRPAQHRAPKFPLPEVASHGRLPIEA